MRDRGLGGNFGLADWQGAMLDCGLCCGVQGTVALLVGIGKAAGDDLVRFGRA